MDPSHFLLGANFGLVAWEYVGAGGRYGAGGRVSVIHFGSRSQETLSLFSFCFPPGGAMAPSGSVLAFLWLSV